MQSSRLSHPHPNLTHFSQNSIVISLSPVFKKKRKKTYKLNNKIRRKPLNGEEENDAREDTKQSCEVHKYLIADIPCIHDFLF